MARKLGWILTAAFLVAMVQVPDASAVTIVTSFAGGNAPANAAGGGNLSDIVSAAARIWERAYSDPGTITIYFGWAPVGDAGTHELLDQGGSPNRETIGRILFDNSGSVAFFLDATPNSNEEYRHRSEEYQDLGGGMVNVARIFNMPTGAAAGRVDLLSVAVHEIGHALGMCLANRSFLTRGKGGVILLDGSLPFAGTAIPLATNNSGFTSHIDPIAVSYGSVMAGISADERRLPSALDILANADISGFSEVNLDITPSRGVSRVEQGAPGVPGIPIVRR